MQQNNIEGLGFATFTVTFTLIPFVAAQNQSVRFSVENNSFDKVFNFILIPRRIDLVIFVRLKLIRILSLANSKSMISCTPWTHLQCKPLLPSKKMSGLLLCRSFSLLPPAITDVCASKELQLGFKQDRDTDGFVIPSLGIGDSGQKKSDSLEVQDSSISVKDKKEEYIYLGPHGAPPSHSKQQEPNYSNRKQRFKQKLKEADRKFGGTGREDKVGHLRELVGGKMPVNASKSSPREWLDPHCYESQFEKRRP